MAIKKKVWNVGKYLIPFRGFCEPKVSREVLANVIYSSVLCGVSVFYTFFAIETKTFNPKEQWRITKQKNEIIKQEYGLNEKLFNFIDNDGDGRHTIDELMNFSKKTGIACNRIPVSYDFLRSSLKLKELEKAVQSYEVGLRRK